MGPATVREYFFSSLSTFLISSSSLVLSSLLYNAYGIKSRTLDVLLVVLVTKILEKYVPVALATDFVYELAIEPAKIFSNLGFIIFQLLGLFLSVVLVRSIL